MACARATEFTQQQRTTQQHTNCTHMARTRSVPWIDKKKVTFNYDSTIDYAADASVDIGAMSFMCGQSAALKWKGESPGMCCNNGRVNPLRIQVPPARLHSTNFHANIRQYNGAFQMTSFSTTGLDAREHSYMPTFRIEGQVYHRAGSLNPPPPRRPSSFKYILRGTKLSKEDFEESTSHV